MNETKTELHNFDLGERVIIINCACGIFSIEGIATIVGICQGEDEYLVRFEPREKPYRRYVDPQAQDNEEGAEAYVRKLNNL